MEVTSKPIARFAMPGGQVFRIAQNAAPQTNTVFAANAGMGQLAVRKAEAWTQSGGLWLRAAV